MLQAIETSEHSSVLSERVRLVTEQMRHLVFNYVSRSLSENDKLVFAFLLAAQVEFQRGNLSETEWRLVVTGTATLREQGATGAAAGTQAQTQGIPPPPPPKEQNKAPKPPEWLPEKLWTELTRLAQVGAPWADLPGCIAQQVGRCSQHDHLISYH